ncbi:MAG: UDP-N-acetylmuramoyl-L-alanyl-D-glutamate--2,6-diaminopimelate ligase [Candidatus Fimenecus sp.]
MNISELLQKVQTRGAYTDAEISDITDKSNAVTKGCVFVCIRGARFDGHTVACDAEKNGAALIVAEHDTGAKNQVLVENTRSAYALLCAAFYGYPAEHLTLIGVTGTNGKTTTTMLLHGVLTKAGISAGLVGTVENRVGEKSYPASLTTPDCKDLQRLFREMVDSGCTHCVMEVSSQALAQHRVDGCHFHIALFTNLTQDHLDYHGDFAHYMQAKKLLFTKADIAVLNIDDASASQMTEGLPVKTVTFSVKRDDADYTAKNVICSANGVQYELLGRGDIGRVQLKIPGHFTVYNSMGAAICAIETGLPFEQVCALLAQSHGVPGRVEVVPTDTDYTVLIDYAHSPDGLENVISSLREVSEKRIITVFGCGGDRDRTKRPKMGKIVGDLADVAVVTSDNPRSENPDAIVQDVLAGMTACKAKIKAITDRTEAIRYALSIAKAGDVVLLAGKGHETYQILNTGKIHYDEREVVAQILKG